MTDIEFEYADYCIATLQNSGTTPIDLDDWFNHRGHRDERLNPKELKYVRSILYENKWIIRDSEIELYSLNGNKVEILRKSGSYSNYCKHLDKETKILKSKSDKKEQLETKIAELTEINLTLQNKQLRTKMLFSVIGFILGVIATNWKEILILLKLISPPETK